MTHESFASGGTRGEILLDGRSVARADYRCRAMSFDRKGIRLVGIRETNSRARCLLSPDDTGRN